MQPPVYVKEKKANFIKNQALQEKESRINR